MPTETREPTPNTSKSLVARSLDPVNSHLYSSSLAPEHAQARQRRSRRSLFHGHSAASTLRAPPRPTTDLRAAINEAKNPNSKLANKAKGTYTDHPPRGSSPPLALETVAGPEEEPTRWTSGAKPRCPAPGQPPVASHVDFKAQISS